MTVETIARTVDLSSHSRAHLLDQKQLFAESAATQLLSDTMDRFISKKFDLSACLATCWKAVATRMSYASPDPDLVEEAYIVDQSYSVRDGLYVLGSLERGVTVYKQQVRAHNLTWAIREVRGAQAAPLKIAVVGGGIAGITATACLLSLFQDASITLFEQLWDLCPLQQGADNRWLHPRIYDWPQAGSRAPGASLPVLNWSEGRASDVCRTILEEFGKYCSTFDADGSRLSVFLGVRYIRILAAKNEISWVGNKARRVGAFFHTAESHGTSDKFDIIILASGFGLERQVEDFPTPSYWRNEQIAQPILDGTNQTFLVSGFGDGAITDLCRLTIERFRQDTVLYELFREKLDDVERAFVMAWPESKRRDNAFGLFRDFENEWLNAARERLAERLRKDTRVVLHISGRDGRTKTLEDIFGPSSSFLNRLLTFLLFRCGAFAISLDKLETAIRQSRVPAQNVLCRYGGDSLGHLLKIFVDPDVVETRLSQLNRKETQKSRRLWKLGTFPVASIGT